MNQQRLWQMKCIHFERHNLYFKKVGGKKGPYKQQMAGKEIQCNGLFCTWICSSLGFHVSPVQWSVGGRLS